MSVNTLQTVSPKQLAKLVLGAILSTGIVLAFATAISFAQTDTNTETDTETANTLKISPLRTDVTADPGETKTVKVLITNLYDKPISVRVIQNDFVADDEDGTPAIILEEDEYAPSHSLKRFMTPIEDVTLEAGEARAINVELVIPDDAEPGGYFGAVRFAPTDPDTGGQVNVSASVASLILLRVNGDAPEKLDLTDFAVWQDDRKKTFFVNGNDIELMARFENKGAVQAGPFGKISVQKGDDVVYEADFNTEQPRDVILPDSARRWRVPLDQTASFGHYTVSATFTYGTSNQTIEVSQSFWVIPRNVIIAAAVGLLVLIAAIVGGVFYFRRRNDSVNRSFGARRPR